MVAAIVLVRFRTAVAQQQPSGLQLVRPGVSMHDLPVHAHDALEGNLAAITLGNTAYSTRNLLFRNVRADHTHSRSMHLVSYLACTLQLGYLLVALHGTLVTYRVYQFQAGSRAQLRGMNPQQVHHLYHQVMPVLWQEMHLASLFPRTVGQFLQLCHRSRISYTRLSSQVSNAVHTAIPYDILDVYVVTNQPFLALVCIYDAHQTLAVLAEIVQEGTVLTELVPVTRIVARRDIVARKDDDTASYTLGQYLAALYVCFLGE